MMSVFNKNIKFVGYFFRLYARKICGYVFVSKTVTNVTCLIFRILRLRRTIKILDIIMPTRGLYFEYSLYPIGYGERGT